jgi:leader peptidase (prepilin peptidase)/N-methyltransferase
VPGLHWQSSLSGAMKESFLGIAVGGGIIYAILRIGKLAFGRQRVDLAGETRVIFTESALQLPDKEIPYEDLFYRSSDVIALQARTLELVDRCYKDVQVRLTPSALRIDDEKLDPEQVPHMEAMSQEIVLPREAMGLGDVKFMAAIGAFLGWKAVIFSLMVSSLIGSVVGVSLIVVGKRAWSSRLPYGPYIAMASAMWVFNAFGGKEFFEWWLSRMTTNT